MQNILNLEYKLEDQAKIDFRLANAALQEEEDKLKQLIMRNADYQRQLKESTTDELDLKKISFLKSAMEIMKTKIRDQMFEIKKAQTKVEEARDKLNEVMIDRKTQEKLKEKAFEVFKKDLLAQESKEIDQLVSFTYRP